MQRLADHVDLQWSDRAHRGLWASRAVTVVRGGGRRLAPGLQGSVSWAMNAALVRRADTVFSIFENAGLSYARGRSLRLPGPPGHTMLTCWLAEDVRHMAAWQLRSVRRSLRSGTRLAVFSHNQVPILADRLDISPSRISVVPFGVDASYYDPALVDDEAGGGGVVAVGSDSRRDYATLAEAARLARVPVTLVCQPRNLTGVGLPDNVTVRQGIYDDAYRRVLHSADLVVTPTIAPAYPSGQSVVVEAMAMGRATLTTDSDAMRDYVRDDVDGALVPAGDPAALARAMLALTEDAPRRELLGSAAARTVRERFTTEHMWDAVALLLSEHDL